jgi:hypothetical protein
MSEPAQVILRVPQAVKAAWVLRSRAAGMRLSDWVEKHMEHISIAEAVAEVGNIAEQITETPNYFGSAQTREGVEAMIQAAAAFAAAQTDSVRADAALWIGEAYLIFSASLPDTGHGEKATSWATANQIAKILGGPEVWEQRVKGAFCQP